LGATHDHQHNGHKHPIHVSFHIHIDFGNK